ncbi:MAG: sulfatase-like hydrolase/transferase [Gammaproteobacteria bacterium]|nr:sulfatase-like hydrolase/transferase [Gammaproteobacteria bacterium]MDP2140591.1 sulfatase-like hydrolase/transferase [Gammaproteobacteria bacterium]MDP2347363.1 sulfatase-like hydrolase/transferase [Gammaproteobacteria bacterium]
MLPAPVPFRIAVFTWGCVFIGSLALAWVPDITFVSLLFLFAATAVQATLLSSPVILLYLWMRSRSRAGKSVRWLIPPAFVLALAVLVFLLANYKLRDMYGFYVNFFVLNLLTTPGGVEAMGVSSSTNISIMIMVLLLGLFTWMVVRYVPLEKVWLKSVTPRVVVPSLLLLFVLQSGWYALSEYRYDRTVLQIADRVIWYIPVTARTNLESMGVQIQRPQAAEFDVFDAGGSIDYPAAPAEKITHPYNIVWLVAESWRADMLTPEIMPNTYAFAQKTHRFQQHYSGGNGTRMGMFSQFYGLYGNYWFDFLSEGRPPVLMDVLQNNDYDLMAYTSSRFSYPEFDKTIFAGFADEQLQSFTEGEAWERDRKNVGDLLGSLEGVETPFFRFMFFESAHANYYFPDEDIIAPDYIDDFNYLTVNIEKDIERIRARYINANHHLDSQLGRVFKALEEQGRLDNTIVIVTGDHGEEFMENGRWGHNSTFSQEQIRVPMLVHIPGAGTGNHTFMSSHLDMPATVLNALGVTTDPRTYSYGSDLLSSEYKRDYAVVSDWHGNTLVTPEVKMVFSKKSAAYDSVTTNIDDDPVDLAKTSGKYKDALGLFTRELSQFHY